MGWFVRQSKGRVVERRILKEVKDECEGDC